MQAYDFSQRDAMARDLRTRLDAIDARIAQLATRPEGKDRVDQLRTRRDQLAKRVDAINDQNERDWVQFRTQVQRDLMNLERDSTGTQQQR
jgi:hypothetical protein